MEEAKQPKPIEAQKPKHESTKKEGEENLPHFKIFGIYDTSQVQVSDAGLKNVLNLREKLILKGHGRYIEKYGRTKMNVVEKMIGFLGVPGHRGKKQKIQTSWASGKYEKNVRTMLEALKIIEEKTKTNPIQILVKAIENSAPCDEITTIEYGGARYPQAVDVSPTRRLALALRNLVHGGYDKAFNKKTNISEGLAAEIIAASQVSNESFAIVKKNEAEKQADSAR